MKQTDSKQRMLELQFISEHTLNEEQLKKLIRDKLERAERHHRSAKVQEERTLQP